MAYELVSSDEEHAVLECPKCGLRADIRTQPGTDRAKIADALRNVRGCECPIGEGGTTAIWPGCKVWRLSDGKKFQVSQARPADQQIKVIDANDHISGWQSVHLYSKKMPGGAFAQRLHEKLAKG